MRLTRAVTRALLQQLYVLHRVCDPNILNQLPERQNNPNNQVFPSATIGDFPYEIFFEIFDSYRQTFQLERDYERIWNSNKGWFKLVHVCRKWRQVVLTSPARLHLRLLFTEHRPVCGRAIAVKNLGPLPRIIDIGSRYDDWTSTTLYRVMAALQYPDRVCRIAISLPEPTSKYKKKLLAAMDRPFLALESLELNCKGARDLNFQLPFLSAQTPHLRRLKYTGYTSTLLSHILSHTTSIVDLTLSLDRVFFYPSASGTHVLSHLQDMPFLRRLELEMWYHNIEPSKTKDVLLSKLRSFCFKGHFTQLEALTAGIKAPSLMELCISLSSAPPVPLSMSDTTHLSRFIHATAKRFLSAQLKASREGIHLSMRTHSHSDDAPPFRIIASSITSIHWMSCMFSVPLATVQDVFLASPFQPTSVTIRFAGEHSSWRTFFTLFHNAKILRVARGIESEVEAILRPGDATSASQFLPALEEIELNATTPLDTPSRIDENELISVLDLFKTFVDARQQEGRPVNIHWNTDGVVPMYFWQCEAEPSVL